MFFVLLCDLMICIVASQRFFLKSFCYNNYYGIEYVQILSEICSIVNWSQRVWNMVITFDRSSTLDRLAGEISEYINTGSLIEM